MKPHRFLLRRHAAALAAATALAVLAALPAFGGEEKPCDQPLEHCVTEMVKKIRAKGWVGIEIDHQDDRTFLVTSIFPDSPASRSDLKVGDRILALNGVYYAKADRAAIKKAYEAMKPDQTIVYTVQRGRDRSEIPIELGRVPEHVLAQWMGSHLLQEHAQLAKKPPKAP